MKKIIFTLVILMTLRFAGAQCTANFSYIVTGNIVTFTNTSNPFPNESFWDFGDGTYSNNNDNSFPVTYTRPGYYLVKLTVIAGNCHASKDTLIPVGTVNTVCNANFDYTVNGYTVSFADLSVGNPSFWLWEFGDGSVWPSATPTPPPAHTYPAGYYNVRLLIYSATNQCMDTYNDVISVGTSNTDCRAGFTFLSNFVTDTVKFFDKSSGNNITQWNWNFGDGTYSSSKDPKKKYNQPGLYNVCLSVGNGTDCYNTGCQKVPIKTTSNTCNASFNYYAGGSGIVNFRENSTGNPTTFHWDFGDGATGTSSNVTHFYSNNGLYLVHLRASNSYSSSDYIQLINVGMGNNVGLQGAFAYLMDNNYHYKAVPVDFKGSSLGDPSYMRWQFGDGDYDSTSFSPLHVYTDTGKYNVCISVLNKNTHQIDTYCKEIHVIEAGVNEFPADKISLSASPNPFNTSTNINYFIPKSTDVSLIIYDLIGNKKAILVNKMQQQGVYTYVWERKLLSNGIYLLEFKTSSGTIVKKLTIVE